MDIDAKGDAAGEIIREKLGPISIPLIPSRRDRHSIHTRSTGMYIQLLLICGQQQIVTLEANHPDVRMLATTWSVKMTGIANIGSLDAIHNNLNVLVGYLPVNQKSPNSLRSVTK
ncbi:MAG: hypothetical protein C0399_04865 [Syntrophus sp. (in: bacteria)]|nr:hypothetical protein [Syntrophus sp. (in: bacteria)]